MVIERCAEQVAPPLTGRPDDFHWHETVDVIVVGFGAAGAATALEIRDHSPSSDVVIVDRFEGGGATALCGGVVYAGGTRHQKAAGFADSGEEMYRYLRLEVGDAVSDATLRQFCDGSNELLEWLERCGVVFGNSVHEGKASYPPPGKFLYYSGNEKVAKYKAVATPAPRGHRTVGKGLTGRPFFDALRRAVQAAGIRQLSHTRVQRLVHNHDGNVIGVEVVRIPDAHRAAHQALYRKVTPMLPFQGRRAENAIAECEAFERRVGERRLIRARHGVVLATGSFTYNVAMLQRYAPATYVKSCLGMLRLGSMGCAGDGIWLGMSVGGTATKLDSVLIARALAPPAALVEGILVNRDGRRFINEDTYLGFLGEAISRQPEGKAWLLFDRAMFWTVMRAMLPDGDATFLTFRLPALANVVLGGTRRGKTLAALAARCGIDAQNLMAEMREFNAVLQRGDQDAFGKVDSYRRQLGAGPYYAINMSLSNPLATTLTFTLGGLRVDEGSGRVLTQADTPIEGLYAVGRTAVGVCSNTYFSGMSLTDCIFSGRRAGRHVAACIQAPR